MKDETYIKMDGGEVLRSHVLSFKTVEEFIAAQPAAGLTHIPSESRIAELTRVYEEAHEPENTAEKKQKKADKKL